MGYVNKKYIKNLHNYEYRGKDNSLISATIGKWWWEYTLSFVPLYVAPNTLTVIGLLFTCISYILAWVYNPTLETELGGIFSFIFGFNLFVYQTLDAIDGKQARRTGSSSPLGQLFDHTCDSLNLTFIVLTISAVFDLRDPLVLLIFMLGAYATFYLATLEEYETGEFYLPAINGPVEGITLVILILTGSSFMGGAIFLTKELFSVEIYGMTIGISPFILGATALAAVGIIGITASLKNLLMTEKFKIFHIIPLVVTSILIVLWAYPFDLIIVDMYPYVFSLTLAFTLTKLISSVIIAHVIDSPLHIPHPYDVYFVLIFGALNSCVLRFDPVHVLFVLFAYSLVSFGLSCYMVITEICDELDIRCFSIKTKKQA